MERRARPGTTDPGIFNYFIGRLMHAAEVLEIAAHQGRILELQEKHTRQYAEEREYFAFHDSLTGAPNRDGLQELARSMENPVAVLWLDVTNFKAINDMYGYEAGDAMIKTTHSLVLSSLRPNDVIGRWGGDEFVVILSGNEELPDSPDFSGEERRRPTRKPTEYTSKVRDGIANRVQYLRSIDSSLEDINYDLAVGATEWDGSISLGEAVVLAEENCKVHKAKQHEKGQHRIGLVE